MARNTVATSVPAPAEDTTEAEARAALQRVVPLGKRIALSSAVDVLALSVEVWSTRVVLHLAYPDRVHDTAQQIRGHVGWAGVDNTGTAYREVGSYWYDAGDTLAETRIFAPGPAATATALTIATPGPSGAGSGFTIPLQA